MMKNTMKVLVVTVKLVHSVTPCLCFSKDTVDHNYDLEEEGILPLDDSHVNLDCVVL